MLFDNVFNSCKLLVHLHKTGIWATEILKNNMIFHIGFVYRQRLFSIVTGEQIKEKVFCHLILSILQTRSVKGNIARYHPERRWKVADETRLDDVQHYVHLGPVCKCAICRKSCPSTCSNQSVRVNVFSQLSHKKQLWFDITANSGLSFPNIFLISFLFFNFFTLTKNIALSIVIYEILFVWFFSASSI